MARKIKNKRQLPRKESDAFSLGEFLNSTSFHGVKHLGAAYFADRCGWAVALLAATVAAIGIFLVVLFRFYSAPTVMTITKEVDDDATFPNVMICPETNFTEAKVDWFISTLLMPENVSVEAVRAGIQQIGAYTDPDVTFDTETLVMLEQVLDYNNHDVVQVTKLMMTSCEDFILKCFWQGDIVDCSRLFVMTMTGDGFCCSFNGRSVYGWSNFASININDPTAPNILIMVLSHEDELPTSVDLGYKWIVIQNSDIYTNIKNNGSALSPGFEYVFTHNLRRLVMSEDTKYMNPSIRQCVQRDEFQLHYFPEYHRNYCLTECEMMTLLKNCSCLKPIHPRKYGDRRCRARDMECASQYVDPSTCDCPVSCEYTQVNLRSDSIIISQLKHVIYDFYEGFDMQHMSVVRVLQADRQNSPEMKRVTYFTHFELISQFGGVFSVYLGCSFISGVELVFLVWRFCRQRRNP